VLEEMRQAGLSRAVMRSRSKDRYIDRGRLRSGGQYQFEPVLERAALNGGREGGGSGGVVGWVGRARQY
jgi:hypothetical protein